MGRRRNDPTETIIIELIRAIKDIIEELLKDKKCNWRRYRIRKWF